MIKAEVANWADFKSKVTSRAMAPQWYEKVRGTPNNNQYRIYAQDGFLMFEWYIEQDGGADVVDFEANYKDNWNIQLDYRDPNGMARVHTSPRPCSMNTYFSGAGDNGGLGSGIKLLFNMTAGESSKSKTITFTEDVHIKDGIVQTIDAPLGSAVDLQVLTSGDVLVKSFAKTFHMLGTGVLYMNTEDSALFPAGYKLKVTVHNSNIANADNEAAKAFKVCGNIEMYRSTTI